ncbi:Sensors of blue-light using FAD family [Verrucomicrobiia bacterium DG1235]|nr:Sensors of blue-light using FAD family [Verrucomicrobiae bacterium DG1235]
MSICRLIYQSIAFEDILANQALAELQESSSARNRELGVTGLLLLSGDRFLQVLEGESDPVNELFAKIQADPRHHTIRLIDYVNFAERYFDNWGMRLVDLYDLPLQPRQYLMQKYSSSDDTVQIPEQLHRVYSLLLDAKTLCINKPWSPATPS